MNEPVSLKSIHFPIHILSNIYPNTLELILKKKENKFPIAIFAHHKTNGIESRAGILIFINDDIYAATTDVKWNVCSCNWKWWCTRFREQTYARSLPRQKPTNKRLEWMDHNKIKWKSGKLHLTRHGMNKTKNCINEKKANVHMIFDKCFQNYASRLKILSPWIGILIFSILRGNYHCLIFNKGYFWSAKWLQEKYTERETKIREIRRSVGVLQEGLLKKAYKSSTRRPINPVFYEKTY